VYFDSGTGKVGKKFVLIYVVCPESNENGLQKNIFIENVYKLM
jgi:hypothetical protein